MRPRNRLEATLRAAIEWHKNPVWGQPDVAHIEKLSKKSLGWLLRKAHDLGLLTDEEYEKLDVGRDEIRNAHQHGRVPSAIKETGPLSGVSIDLSTGEQKREALDPKKRPDVAWLSLLLYDYRFGPLWVRQIDYVVQKLMAPVIKLAAEMRARGELGGLGVLPSE